LFWHSLPFELYEEPFWFLSIFLLAVMTAGTCYDFRG